jgi:hypothetical protein
LQNNVHNIEKIAATDSNFLRKTQVVKKYAAVSWGDESSIGKVFLLEDIYVDVKKVKKRDIWEARARRASHRVQSQP